MDRSGTQKADVIWRDGDVPVSVLFDDPYFSRADGLAEARHVFLAGNSLPARFGAGFHVAELGFGCGLNALAAASAWKAADMPGALRLTSFEAWPMDPADMARALAPWPDLAPLAAPLVGAWATGARTVALPGLDLEIIEGDARDTLPAWTGRADAWFLDGFAPARNPELWEPGLLVEVARHTRPGGTFATYSAASGIRESLSSAGFIVTRAPGFGAKKHMSRGVLRVS